MAYCSSVSSGIVLWVKRRVPRSEVKYVDQGRVVVPIGNQGQCAEDVLLPRVLMRTIDGNNCQTDSFPK
jgi:hypothetical protein